jgi:hypothetical protein
LRSLRPFSEKGGTRLLFLNSKIKRLSKISLASNDTLK